MNTVQNRFACPVDKFALDDQLRCTKCQKQYPTSRGIPVLLNDDNSLFETADYLEKAEAYSGASNYSGSLDETKGLRQLYRKFVHSINETPSGARGFSGPDAISRVYQIIPNAKVLVIGAGEISFEGDVTYTDVAFAKNANCIADAHDLPFVDASFDAIFAIAVLEHVIDPNRCLAEIERVLKPNGFVYAETPFLQPVHMRQYDFTRFTFLGHRRLFRKFDELSSGVTAGPGAVLGQIFQYYLTFLLSNSVAKKILRLIGLLVGRVIRSSDKLVSRSVSAYDSASGFYFFGRMRATKLSDREILKFFKGGD
jgi:SAM-dependent methyltransferase